jgi:hypothetical protein
MRRYLHQWAGLNLTGHMGEQILHFWYGRGGNAKSTTIDAWAAAAGDYSTTVPIETFLDQGIKKRGDQATPDLARLGGVRMLRTSEPERGAKLAAALIKLVTGGEPMAVRFLNRGFFDLRPIFKLTISGNYRPEIPDTDDGIWRRVKLIPWEQRVRDEQHPEGTREKDTGPAEEAAGRIAGHLQPADGGAARLARERAGRAEGRDHRDAAISHAERPARALPDAVHEARPTGGCNRPSCTSCSWRGVVPPARRNGPTRA